MKLSDYLESILFGKDLASKLVIIPTDLEYDLKTPSFCETPARDAAFAFSDKQIKFPRGDFHLSEKTAIALHSFANHELLAIELMAATLLKFPAQNEQQLRLHKGILQALREEQLHFKLYHARLNQLGYQFGDFPVNDFFWKYFARIDSIQSYLSVMALTFEAANLDFASYYQQVFHQVGDEQTAQILQTVLEDEITHVALGVHYMNQWRGDKSLWDYYRSCLPFPLTPARSKGKIFFSSARVKARMDSEFIDQVKAYQDPYRITNRKEWKS